MSGAALLVTAGGSAFLEVFRSSQGSTTGTLATVVAIIAGATSLVVGVLRALDRVRRRIASFVLLVGGASAAIALAAKLSSFVERQEGTSPLVWVGWAAGGACLVAATFCDATIRGRSSAQRSRFSTSTKVIAMSLTVVVMNAVAGLAAAGTASAPGGTVANLHSPSVSSELSSPFPTTSSTPAWLDTDLAALRVAVPGEVLASCSTASPSELVAPAVFATAALRCAPETGLLATYWLMPDAWSGHRVLAGLATDNTLGAGPPGCWDGKPGDAQYAHGLVSCRIDGGLATVTWTDDRIPAVGVASSPAPDLWRVVDWWWNVGMLIPGTAAASPDSSVSDLLDLVSPWLRAACAPEGGEGARATGDPVGATVAIACAPTNGIVGSVTWYRFATRASLDAWFDRSVAAARIPAGSHGCYSGGIGLGTWATGRVACSKGPSDAHAMVTWTNERTLTFGTLSGRGSSVQDLFAWWQGNGAP